MATLVSVEAYSGTLTRYEIGGHCARATHRCSAYGPATFTPKIVEEFRLRPDPKFAIDPGPRPTNPPAAAGRMAA